MTVKELIAKLQQEDGEKEVVITSYRGGCSLNIVGDLTQDIFEGGDFCDEEDRTDDSKDVIVLWPL